MCDRAVRWLFFLLSVSFSFLEKYSNPFLIVAGMCNPFNMAPENTHRLIFIMFLHDFLCLSGLFQNTRFQNINSWHCSEVPNLYFHGNFTEWSAISFKANRTTNRALAVKPVESIHLMKPAGVWFKPWPCVLQQNICKHHLLGLLRGRFLAGSYRPPQFFTEPQPE